MSRLFGRRNKDEKSKGRGGKGDEVQTGDAIRQLHDMEDMLYKKQEYLENKINAEVAVAKRNAKTNKRVALQALKRKKKYEQQLVQIDGTLTTLEQQRETLESAQSNTKILSTMGDAAKALKKAHAHMDVDKVHDMIDDISEQQQVAKEISDAISSPVNWNADFDEDDLEAELDGLLEEQELEEQSTLDEELLKVGPTPVLPDIPVDAVPAAQPAAASKPKKAVVEEDEMAELAAWAS